MSSSSSIDAGLEPGTEVAGFRIERELGRGGRGAVYEATQLTLDRRVALKLLRADKGTGSLRWPDHRHVVRLYATGRVGHGRYVAMQLVRGPSLARLRERGRMDAARAIELLGEVAQALDAAHREGIVHGAITSRNVLVGCDGEALLSDFGLGERDGSVAADRAAFAALVRGCLDDAAPPVGEPAASATEIVDRARAALPATSRAGTGRSASGWRRPALVAAAVCLVVAGAALAVMSTGAEDESPRVPRLGSGGLALGSGLTTRRVESVDCRGGPPGGSSPACTLVQMRLPGRRLVVPRAGAIRRWAVRGADGELALQVIRRRGDHYVSVARTPYQRVAIKGVHVFRASIAVRAGDRVGVQMLPGAVIGVQPRVRGAVTARWIAPLVLTARRVELGEGTGFDHEVLMRAELVPGATAGTPGTLSGRPAARAQTGKELVSREVEAGGAVRRVAVVRVAGAIAVDLFAGDLRLMRLPVPDADGAGRLQSFGAFRGPYPVLRWRNPDGRTVIHEYTVGAGALTARS